MRSSWAGALGPWRGVPLPARGLHATSGSRERSLWSPGWLTTAGLISGCSESGLIRTLTCTFGVCFQPCERVKAGRVPGLELRVLLRDCPALGSPAVPSGNPRFCPCFSLSSAGRCLVSCPSPSGSDANLLLHQRSGCGGSSLGSGLARGSRYQTCPRLLLALRAQPRLRGLAVPPRAVVLRPDLGPCCWCRLRTVGAGGRGAA